MILVKQSVEVLDYNKERELTIEKAGRTCWKSEAKIGLETYIKFIRMIKQKKHFAMLEFCWMAVRIICNRSVSHQLVRHRHFSFAQESQHYIKYGENMRFVLPEWLTMPVCLLESEITNESFELDIRPKKFLSEKQQLFIIQMLEAEFNYKAWIQENAKAQEARCCLPNAMKTEICMAGNGRSWVEFLDKRLGDENTRDIQNLALQILDKLAILYPTVLLEVANVNK